VQKWLDKNLAGSLWHNPWIEFWDTGSQEWRICQPDTVWQPGRSFSHDRFSYGPQPESSFSYVPSSFSSPVVVFEMKAREKAAALDELLGVYMPVAGEFWGQETAGVQVCGALDGEQTTTAAYGLGPADMPAVEAGSLATWFLRV
jgi:hypothetical protein